MISTQPKNNQVVPVPSAGGNGHASLDFLREKSKVRVTRENSCMPFLCELIPICPMKERKYTLSDVDTDVQFANFKESSSCPCRLVCEVFRSWKGTFNSGTGDQPLFEIEHGFQPIDHLECPDRKVLCCIDGGVSATVQTKEKANIGSIVHTHKAHSTVRCVASFLTFGLCPPPICNQYELTVKDELGNPKYVISKKVIEIMCAPHPCFGGKDTDLTISNPNGIQVGAITKKFNKRFCLAQCEGCDPADDWIVSFPEDASTQDKANILSALMLWAYHWSLP